MYNTFIRFMKIMGERLPVYLLAILLSTTGDTIRRIASSSLVNHIITAAQAGSTDKILETVSMNFIVLILGLLLWRFGIIRYNIEGRIGAGKAEKLVYSKAMRLPMSYYEKTHSGDFMSKLIFDTQRACDIYTSRLRRFLSAVISTIIYLIPMLSLSPELTLCLIAISSIALIINVLFARPMKTTHKCLSRKNSIMLEKLTNLLAGMELVKIFPVGPRLSKEYEAAGEEYFHIQKKANRLTAGLECVNCFIDLTGALAFLGLGIWFVSLRKISLGQLSALYVLYGSFRNAFSDIGLYFPQIIDCMANVEKLFEFLDLEEEPPQWDFQPYTAMEQPAPASQDSILSLQNVCFSYRDQQKILDHVSMEIKRGSFTAITGESGCGKSTLAKLLLGFYPLEKGSITLDSKPYSTLTLKEIREQISYVPQEPYLYETTIAENIAYGRYGSSREDVIAAAKAANAHDFIIKLPHGYDTIPGPRGNTLSGGQRQRIAIARAIIRNTPIIILDEATSALDNESEALVQEAVKALKGERTILMIAHRPSSIASADAVIQFRKINFHK